MKKSRGFTIVELLIVIVVIGILAAITIVAFSGVQERARATTVSSDIAGANKVVKLAEASAGNPVTTLAVLQESSKINATKGMYKVLTVCTASQGYAVAAELNSGDVYYSRNGAPAVKDNSVNALDPCTGFGWSTPTRIFAGMPATSCANENGTCTFSGAATVAYGSLAQGRFTAMKDQTSPVACTNPYFGDPASGFAKACYVISN